MDQPSAFYTQVDEHEFESTTATSSPWDESLQHGGPPAALLAHVIEQTPGGGPGGIARITVDMLGGIPQGRMRATSRVVRPGRRVELVEASLSVGDRVAVSATAWRIVTSPDATRAQAAPALELPPLPDEQPQEFFPGTSPEWGYGRAVDWRFVEGGYAAPGPAALWARVRIPLVAGLETSPVGRLLVVADSANGLSGELPLAEWLFIPPTLSVTVLREPAEEWLWFDARSTIGPHGRGLAQATLADRQGLVAAVAQPLLVAPR
ncbi:thioesterase family protein [Nocardioides aurantiacus]|uniref:Thioesterase superfamily protein n=1 Tax=Nocardioides aurantiacus TaxID=86796 RepID=A0A3N2CZP7_9ACTN|nr:thioesterase family protein [Nocardioides aurantiacus]ROR92999.1 thioesterase superfamily protein [Nocardioides aurantiacus]